MSGPTLSVLIATIGRPSLARTLDSIAPQIGPNDEVIVCGDVYDGPLPETEAICRDYPWVRYITHASDSHWWGHPQMMEAQAAATKEWLFGLDDDDIFVCDAFQAIRKAIAAVPEPMPLLFQFKSYFGITFWHTRGLVEQGHIGGHCLVFPNVPAKFGTRTVNGKYRYESDFTWVQTCLARWAPVGPAWVEYVTVVCRPAGGE